MQILPPPRHGSDIDWHASCIWFYVQLFRATVLQVDYINFSLVVSSLAGSLIGTCALGITIVASRKPQQLALLLNQWQQTETEIGLLILTRKSSTFLFV